MTPTVFRYKNYGFFFFSKEEKRMHIHVRSTDGEAKFWMEPRVAPFRSCGFSAKEVKELQRVIEEHHDEIVAAWKKHFES